MKRILLLSLFTSGLMAATTLPVQAAEGGRFWTLQNTFRIQYDDNVNQSSTNAEDSVVFTDNFEFQVNLDLENTFIGARYRPTFRYYENRPADDTDLHHDFDIILDHRPTPRLALGFKDTLNYVENPEIIERGVLVRDENDYLYNDFRSSVKYRVLKNASAEASMRYILLRYDNEETADREDFDLLIGGLTGIYELKPETTLNGELQFETVDYESTDVDRGADTISVSGSVEQNFSPNLLGSFRAGFQMKDFSDAQGTDSTDSPFGDVSVTFVPSPDTRVTGGGRYSLFEANVFPYVNQERTRFFGSVAHDVTSRITVFASYAFVMSNYDRKEVAGEAEAIDGDEDVTQLSTRVSYELNRSNWIDLSYQFTDFTSDLRDEYDRNRVSLGWKTSI